MKAKKPRREALYVQVPSPDGVVEFHDASAYLGRQMPFKNPKATCGMRVSDDVVSFSLLHMTKKTATAMAAKELLMPRGPLTRVERRAAELAETLQADEVIIESEQGVQRCRLLRDQNGVAELEPVDADVTFELPREAVKLSIYLRPAHLGRLVAVGFIGHPGRPGSPETLRRVSSMALFSLTQLSQFRVISAMVSMVVPPPLRATAAPRVRKAEDRAQLEVPVWLFADGNPPALVVSGSVLVEVDLELANPATGKLLYRFTPSETIAAVFDEYRNVLDSTITEVLRHSLDDAEINAIAVEIVLGEVDAGTVGRLRDGLLYENLLVAGLDLTPRQRQFHS